MMYQGQGLSDERTPEEKLGPQIRGKSMNQRRALWDTFCLHANVSDGTITRDLTGTVIEAGVRWMTEEGLYEAYKAGGSVSDKKARETFKTSFAFCMKALVLAKSLDNTGLVWDIGTIQEVPSSTQSPRSPLA